jgi:hypothetical protein
MSKESKMTPDLTAIRCARLLIAFAIGATILAGCTTVGPQAPTVPSPAEPAPSAPAVPRNAEPPPPKVNLSGFPLPYRQGYADGCASVGGTEHKDAARFSADMNYRTGWTDGKALCAKK